MSPKPALEQPTSVSPDLAALAARRRDLLRREAAWPPTELNAAARERIVAERERAWRELASWDTQLSTFDATSQSGLEVIRRELRFVEYELRETASRSIQAEVDALDLVRDALRSGQGSRTPASYRAAIEDLTTGQHGRAIGIVLTATQELREVQLQGLDAAGAERAIGAFRMSLVARLRALAKGG